MEKPAELHSHEIERVSVEEKVVLVIDDSLDMLTLNRTILEMDGFKVFTAQSGKEALKVLSEINAPDLILLDMQMANMSGPDFLVALEEKRPDVIKNVPVVFLSAMDKIPPSRAVGFIRKPFDMDKFIQAVHRFIEKGAGHPRYEH